MSPWRNGGPSDSRSEGCVFESRRGQIFHIFPLDFYYRLVQKNRQDFVMVEDF